jgi:hypothetical protein
VRQFPAAIVLKTSAALIAVSGLIWVAASAGVYLAMSQTPERFGAIMARVPRIGMMVLPFKRLWMSARAGSLRIGDPAPDFTLPLLHGDRSVTLSAESRRKPVVLIFGSYT